MESIPDDKLASCNNCSHYYITHDVNFKYGCRALDFKCQRQPVLVVIEASGQPCHFFREKERCRK